MFYAPIINDIVSQYRYLAPEYASSGKLTEKSDVFSFGVMLLEIVTGRRPVDLQNMADDSLVDWVSTNISQQKLLRPLVLNTRDNLVID